MVQLLDQDIQTREVLDWNGVHLFHFMGSSCSQKVRVFLNFKDIQWKSHQIDLGKTAHFTPWYLGINPRGLVPTLVWDGAVHIESNDIIQLLDQKFLKNKLIPVGSEGKISQLLHHEDDLHLDLRTLTFRFTQPRGKVPRSKKDLQIYRETGSGTIQGKADPNKNREIKFWETAAENGITDAAVQKSAQRFRAALNELNQKLIETPYLMGDEFSVLDIAWIIYVNRLVRCGYPLERLHPAVNSWFWPLREIPEVASEIGVPTDVQKAVEVNHQQQKETKTTLIDVAGL